MKSRLIMVWFKQFDACAVLDSEMDMHLSLLVSRSFKASATVWVTSVTGDPFPESAEAKRKAASGAKTSVRNCNVPARYSEPSRPVMRELVMHAGMVFTT